MSEKDNLTNIESVILQRIEGIKRKKPDMIREVINTESYTKFDDWPPGLRMQGEEAIQNEEGALKVLDEYRYTIRDLTVKAASNFAWASFYFKYDGSIRNRRFDIKSRVSIVLAKSGSQWRIVHEHFSILPETVPVDASETLSRDTKVLEKNKDLLNEAIMKVLGDGSERNIAELTKEVSKIVGKEVPASQVIDRCQVLVSEGFIKRRGRFYPRYQISSAA